VKLPGLKPPVLEIAERGRPLGGPLELWLSYRILPALLAAVMKVLFYTLRVRYEGDAPVRELVADGERFILAFYHRRLISMPHAYPYRRFAPDGSPRGVAILSSDSKDGERSTFIWRFFRIRSIRGTATHGGAQALVKLIRALKDGWDLGMAVDGPRGPREEVKPGLVVAARKTGAWLVPVCVAYERAWELGTWDRLLVPHPFSGLVVHYDPPFQVPAGTGEEACQALIKERLDQLEGWARTAFSA
jgi:lysophospholipid acyltransferase (LPLAT)-like uncharacterized protein